MEIPNYELAAPAPAAWVEIFGRRLSLWEEQQLLLPQHPNLPAAPTALVDSAHLIAEAHVQANPFGANSVASQVGASAWFISAAFWVCMSLMAERWLCRLLLAAPSVKVRSSAPSRNFEFVVPSLSILEVCLALSLHQSVSNSPARA